MNELGRMGMWPNRLPINQLAKHELLGITQHLAIVNRETYKCAQMMNLILQRLNLQTRCRLRVNCAMSKKTKQR